MDFEFYEEALTLAEKLANVARAVSLSYFRTALPFDSKEDKSPVTLADREVERVMREMIDASFPEHAICGEEFGSEGTARYTWLLDPIDGTKPFLMGFPLFGSLIALLDQQVPKIGIIETPATGERWNGTSSGTSMNGRPASVSARPGLPQPRPTTSATTTIRNLLRSCAALQCIDLEEVATHSDSWPMDALTLS
nr:inositol monophosphatase family protein [Paraburkholderia guartelaensis]